MSYYTFEGGDQVWYYCCNGDKGRPAVVMDKVRNENSPHNNKDDWYRICLVGNKQEVVFYRNLFPRWPTIDFDSHGAPPVDVWQEVSLYDGANVRHRKGHRLGDATAAFILSRAKEELEELEQAPDDVEEMADLMATLIHYCVRKGWTRDQLDRAMLTKMKLRLGDRAWSEENEKSNESI